jgi:hypothetical protein
MLQCRRISHSIWMTHRLGAVGPGPPCRGADIVWNEHAGSNYSPPVDGL